MATRRKRTPDEMKQIEGLAAAALGIDAKRGDLLAVENLSFQTLQQEAPLPPTMLEKLQRNLRNWTWLLRYLALACLFGSVYLLLLRPLKKQLLTAFRELPLRAAASRPIAGEANPGEAAGGRKTDTLEDILGGAAAERRPVAEEAGGAEESAGGEGQDRAGGRLAAGAELVAGRRRRMSGTAAAAESSMACARRPCCWCCWGKKRRPRCIAI